MGQQNSFGCSTEERIPLLTSAKVSIAVSSNCVWFLDIIFSVVIVAFVVGVLILNTRGGAHVVSFYLLTRNSLFISLAVHC